MAIQQSLFEEAVVAVRIDDYEGIRGLTYFSEILDPSIQTMVMDKIDASPWRDDLKRRVQHYGYRYDYKSRNVDRSMQIGELPEFAIEIAHRMIDLDLIAEVPDQMIVNEYEPGQGISAHVDCEPCFKDSIVTISLGSVYEMDFISVETGEVRSILLELGSAVIMTGESRYRWMHRIKARKSDRGVLRGRRVSLTFRNVILMDRE